MKINQLLAFAVLPGDDELKILHEANDRYDRQNNFWNSFHGIEYKPYIAMYPTDNRPTSMRKAEMRALAAEVWPDVEMTHYQLHRSSKSEGDKGGYFSRVDWTGVHWTSPEHETGHGILNREHAGVQGGSSYGDRGRTIMSSSANGDGRRGLSGPDIYFAGLGKSIKYKPTKRTYKLERVESHPASHLGSPIIKLPNADGTFWPTAFILSARMIEGQHPFGMSANQQDTVFVHEIHTQRPEVGQSWAHSNIKPGSPKKLANGLTVQIIDVDDCITLEIFE